MEIGLRDGEPVLQNRLFPLIFLSTFQPTHMVDIESTMSGSYRNKNVPHPQPKYRRLDAYSHKPH
ncbi:hypothetical protein [Microseira wollei]|uniref:hypothetical protein n=1 Tax=Microseira wollei TaxID=467598 RepID=UPI001CFCEF69|nr:hypothetical protein [Microseira wollei]